MEHKQIPPEKFERYLPEGDWIRVVVEDGPKKGEMWDRERVVDHMKQNGAEMAGEQAMGRGFGIFSGGVFIASRKEKPA